MFGGWKDILTLEKSTLESLVDSYDFYFFSFHLVNIRIRYKLGLLVKHTLDLLTGLSQL